MDDLLIQYRGFSPSEFPKHYIRCLMEQLREEAPSSATMRVSVSRSSDHKYCGFIRISSGARPFFVTASAEKLMTVIHLLLDRARRQLDKWKTTRFSRESLKEKLQEPERASSFTNFESAVDMRGRYDRQTS